MSRTYHALANTWYYPEPAEAIMRKKKKSHSLQTTREEKMWAFTAGSSRFLQIRLSSAMPL